MIREGERKRERERERASSESKVVVSYLLHQILT